MRVCLAVLVLALPGSCLFLRIRNFADIRAYREMASESHPVWLQFALRRFGVGDPAKKLFQRFPPSYRQEFGRYGLYSYHRSTAGGGISFSGFTVITRDGKLIGAGAAGCTWRFTFFNTPDPEVDRQYAAFVRERQIQGLQRSLGLLSKDLYRFYASYRRWPTNEGEFGTFVTGKTQADEQIKRQRLSAGIPEQMRALRKRFGIEGDGTWQSSTNELTAEARRFRERYGLVDPPPEPFNPLGIKLEFDPYDHVCMAYNGEPGVASVLASPE